VRGCFALWKRTRHGLSLAFDYQMRADLVVSTIDLVEFAVPGTIFHSDQGSQYGALETRTALLRKGLQRSMSRAGIPTDNGYAERFVLSSPSRNGGPIAHWESFSGKPSAGSIFITSLGLMKACSSSRLITLPEIMTCQRLLICPYFNVQVSGYLTMYH
jgi:hypothetical protein